MHSKLTPLSLGLFLLGASAPVYGHGAAAEYRQVSAIEVRGSYDNGDPISEAQISIYAPENPNEPWLEGTTQEDGTFVFVPDPEQTGDWVARVRKGGHGDMTTIEVETPQEEETQTQTSSSDWQGGGYTPLQTALMAILGVWGFVGTALFFASKKSANQEDN